MRVKARDLKTGLETQLAKLQQEMEQLHLELPIEIKTKQLPLLQAILILQEAVEKSGSHLVRAVEAKIEAVDAQIEELSASTNKQSRVNLIELNRATDKLLKELKSVLERKPEGKSIRPARLGPSVRILIKERAARSRLKQGHSVEQVARELELSSDMIAAVQRELFQEYHVNSSRELAEAVRLRDKAAE